MPVFFGKFSNNKVVVFLYINPLTALYSSK